MHIRQLVLTALFSALIATGAYIAVPIGPVPITLQTLFIIIAGLLAGPKVGLSAVLLYLAAGAAGVPVFSAGTGGIGHFAGPTGGFLIAAVPASLIAGTAARLESRTHRIYTYGLTAAAVVLASLTFYLVGVPWLKISLDLSWQQALGAGMLPFIPGDLIKAIAAVALYGVFRERIRTMLEGEQS
jgi:biotin transport system substrate-specific component